ncbi:MAG: hypothetical protein H8E44_38785 [Planctomycetes bacterium]|nr:hypothetical protein [Planctomycetota bacterium]MBL7043375.1 hypothetical protein [Pirellulaceae bacterium]
MSNSVRRPPLRGVILRGKHVVGGVDLPNPSECFIEHFNQEYEAAGLRVIRADVFQEHEATSSPQPPVARPGSATASTQSF